LYAAWIGHIHPILHIQWLLTFDVIYGGAKILVIVKETPKLKLSKYHNARFIYPRVT